MAPAEWVVVLGALGLLPFLVILPALRVVWRRRSCRSEQAAREALGLLPRRARIESADGSLGKHAVLGRVVTEVLQFEYDVLAVRCCGFVAATENGERFRFRAGELLLAEVSGLEVQVGEGELGGDATFSLICARKRYLWFLLPAQADGDDSIHEVPTASEDHAHEVSATREWLVYAVQPMPKLAWWALSFPVVYLGLLWVPELALLRLLGGWIALVFLCVVLSLKSSLDLGLPLGSATRRYRSFNGIAGHVYGTYTRIRTPSTEPAD